ncbi:hypothetical protein AVEN_213659-1 [Araneus ventricosus]|uniref:Uncharacterized protein n=1 Tax=Araneus ventricosus TaxID=182803 RepID=A0A4Y2QWT2_ARAVE|nr:hypothetical protein AVEN_213659-1 [Araneus ventricosus]
MKDRPPRHHIQALWFLHYIPHYERLMQQPPFYRGTTRLRKWAQRATPPLLCHRVNESLLTYTAASPPRTHGVSTMGYERQYTKTSGKLLVRIKYHSISTSSAKLYHK